VVGSTECPDFFELPVDGDAKNTKWVFWGGSNQYVIGSFDGKTFKAEAGPFPSHWGKNRYAAQTFSDIPAADGRRIQIAWMAGGKYPRMPFNQQFTFPTTLTLHTFADGIRLCTLPIQEIDKLHQKLYRWRGPLNPDTNPLSKVRGDTFDIRLKVRPGEAKEVGLMIRGVPIRYNVQEKTLTCMDASAPVELVNGCLAIQVLVDRASIEIFTADGRVNMAYCFTPPVDDKGLAVFAQDGIANVQSLDVWTLRSIWDR
jgi:sucrose-6-phosphate hydrolase SacC (GH32 family)